jgi:hypothetical protein
MNRMQLTGFHGSPSLSPNWRGIVLGPTVDVTLSKSPYNVLVQPGYPEVDAVTVPDLIIPRTQIYHGLMFWEKLAVPVLWSTFAGAVNVRYSEEDRVLLEEGKIVSPLFDFGGIEIIDSIIFDGLGVQLQGDHAYAVLRTQIEGFRALIEDAPGRWVVASNSEELPKLIGSQSQTGIALELVNCVPVVTEIDDIERYLRFLENRTTERRRLMGLIDAIAAEIEREQDVIGTLQRRKAEISSACSDVLRVTSEGPVRFTSGLLRFNLDWNLGRLLTWPPLAEGLVGSFIDLRPLPAIIGLLASQVRVRPGPLLDPDHPSNSPFATVVKLQYPG